jgi:hypothetical protein
MTLASSLREKDLSWHLKGLLWKFIPIPKSTQKKLQKPCSAFWKSIARNHGGQVDAAWIESFILIHPDGTLHATESRREIILTDQEFGHTHPDMPLRALYISKSTNKPAVMHTEEEELLEMRPVIDALTKLVITLS